MSSLYTYACALGVHIDFDSRVIAIDSSMSNSSVMVTLAGRKAVVGDLVIGADGERSIVRRVLQAQSADGDIEDSPGPFTTLM